MSELVQFETRAYRLQRLRAHYRNMLHYRSIGSSFWRNGAAAALKIIIADGSPEMAYEARNLLPKVFFQ